MVGWAWEGAFSHGPETRFLACRGRQQHDVLSARQGRSCQDQYDEWRWEAGIQPECVKKVLLSERRSHYQ